MANARRKPEMFTQDRHKTLIQRIFFECYRLQTQKMDWEMFLSNPGEIVKARLLPKSATALYDEIRDKVLRKAHRLINDRSTRAQFVSLYPRQFLKDNFFKIQIILYRYSVGVPLNAELAPAVSDEEEDGLSDHQGAKRLKNWPTSVLVLKNEELIRRYVDARAEAEQMTVRARKSFGLFQERKTEFQKLKEIAIVAQATVKKLEQDLAQSQDETEKAKREAQKNKDDCETQEKLAADKTTALAIAEQRLASAVSVAREAIDALAKCKAEKAREKESLEEINEELAEKIHELEENKFELEQNMQTMELDHQAKVKRIQDEHVKVIEKLEQEVKDANREFAKFQASVDDRFAQIEAQKSRPLSGLLNWFGTK